MWTVDQDTAITDPLSLIKALRENYPEINFAAYYPNYAAYNDQRALPGKAYMITDSDLEGKLPKLDKLIYAFAETQIKRDTVNNYINTPHSYGAVYLYDPWSDLSHDDSFCGKQGTPDDGIPRDANGYNLICGYAFDSDSTHHHYDDSISYNSFGNFEAFSKLSSNDPHKPLSKALSIGGFGHNETFEAIFRPQDFGVTTITSTQAIDNFVNSLLILMKHYNLDSVDIDYENVQMTHQESEDYLVLLTALNEAFAPLGKTITLPIITNPDYISGTESGNTVGFAPGVLKKIADLSQVTAIQLMTYDFSGTFSIVSDKRTGFLTNTYLPNNYPDKTPGAYNFSVETATQAAIAAGIPPEKISLGIPSYGRALSNIPNQTSTDETYLFSSIDSSDVIIPRGDQDSGANFQTGTPACDQDITHWDHSDACQGMFSYQYLVHQILPLGKVIATDHTNNSGNAYNGSTAFGKWSPPEPSPDLNYSLTVVNNNGASGQVDITNGANDFNTRGYFPTGTQVYSPTALSGIEGAENLTASFTYWKQKILCSGSVKFDHNITVNITSDAVPACSIQ
jgi:GH18 family chitinase